MEATLDQKSKPGPDSDMLDNNWYYNQITYPNTQLDY